MSDLIHVLGCIFYVLCSYFFLLDFDLLLKVLARRSDVRLPSTMEETVEFWGFGGAFRSVAKYFHI